MMSHFRISNEDRVRVLEWDKLHILNHHGGVDPEVSHPTAIGGRLSFEFTPTGLGVILKVSCSCNVDSLDLTDYESW